MNELQIEMLLPMPPLEGPPLPRFLGIYWPWYKKIEGFVLGIENPPAGAYWWIPDFAENTFNYDPPAASGALRVDQVWDYPSDPRGCTTLHIMVFDAQHNVLLDAYNLGPVNKGKSYTYDCATEILRER